MVGDVDLERLSMIAVLLAIVCAAYLVVAVVRRPEKMWIMNLVWPITALYFGPFAIWAYYAMGRRASKPFWQSVAVGGTHCGAGCTLGDIIAEFALFTIVGASIAGWARLGLAYAADFALAYILGVAFQYFAIAPMRGEWGRKSLVAAIQADTLSLTAFEIGLFGWMAITQMALFRPGLQANQWSFWFLMQIGMVLGYFTAFAVNWWLIARGIKERM
jgi:Domain of unknown function (DUF4396)